MTTTPTPPAPEFAAVGLETPGIATCSYTGFRPEMGTPVRTSIGSPRFKLPYRIEFKIESLMPYGCRHIEDRTEFEAAYLPMLDRNAGVIAAALKNVYSRSGLRPVLLCFEDVHKAGVWCHRQVAAKWIEERCGFEVPELSQPKPARAPRGKTTLPQLPLAGEVGQIDSGRSGGR